MPNDSPAPGGLSISDAVVDGRLTVTVGGELDIATIAHLTRRLDTYKNETLTGIVLDLRRLSFIDSTGMRALIGADALARQTAVGLTILISQGPVHRALTASGLAGRLPIEVAGERASDLPTPELHYVCETCGIEAAAPGACTACAKGIVVPVADISATIEASSHER